MKRDMDCFVIKVIKRISGLVPRDDVHIVERGEKNRATASDKTTIEKSYGSRNELHLLIHRGYIRILGL
jgi:hypothetical protein